MFVSCLNGHISFEHTHPPQEYIFSKSKFRIIGSLRKNLMKSLIKKIAKSQLVTKLRDGFGIRPLIFNTNNLNENVSISDAFIWRTDNSYKTIFKYSDLLKIFLSKGQEVEIFFYIIKIYS